MKIMYNFSLYFLALFSLLSIEAYDSKSAQSTEPVTTTQSCTEPDAAFLAQVLEQMKEESPALSTEENSKIDGILPAKLSSGTRAEYLVYSSVFYGGSGTQLRSVAKVVCNKKKWKIKGFMEYGGVDLTEEKLVDVNNDGIQELIDEGLSLYMGICSEYYIIQSWQTKTPKILFRNLGTDLLCGGGFKMSASKVGDIISTNYEMTLEDTDGDGMLELVEEKIEGVHVKGNTEEEASANLKKTTSKQVYKYDAKQDKFIK